MLLARKCVSKVRCGWCRLWTSHPQHWEADRVCPSCYFHERNEQDQLDFGDSVQVCRDLSICVYCGEGAEEIEHVVPRCTGLPTWTVPSCRECNLTAGGTLDDGFVARKLRVHRLLRRKYKSVLRTGQWERDELDELGYVLRVKVMEALAAKQIVEARLRWTLPGEKGLLGGTW